MAFNPDDIQIPLRDSDLAYVVRRLFTELHSTVRSGTGTPEGAVAAPVGTLYRRTDGGTDTTLYVKETGASTNTGWVAK